MSRRVLALVVAGAALLGAPARSHAHGVQRFDNGLWFTGDGFERRSMFSVSGVIRQAFDGPVDAVVDLGGRYVIPPFADAHNHGFADGRDPAALIASSLAEGIFYVKNPNNLPRLAAPIRPRVNTPESLDVRYANGGFTSSGGHPAQIYAQVAPHLGVKPEEMAGEAYYAVDSVADLDRTWPQFIATRPDFVKAYLVHSEEHAKRRADAAYFGQRGLDPVLLVPLVAKAHAAGLRVTAHVDTAADFRTAVHEGVDEIAHLPLEPLEPADARAAAARHVVVVTTTLSHRPTPGIADIDALHRHNLQLLHAAGVVLVLGTDGERSVVAEAENLRRLGAFDPLTLLRLWCEATPRAIFPERKLGQLADGYEASFLALDGNPLEDFGAIRKLALRVKRGHVLEVSKDAVRRPHVAGTLAHIAITRGATAALAEYTRLQREQPDAWDFGELSLNQIGYLLLQKQRVDEAIDVFGFNARLFPASPNVHDSLGEAYMTKGETARAIESYQRTLLLSPENENAKARLIELRAPRRQGVKE